METFEYLQNVLLGCKHPIFPYAKQIDLEVLEANQKIIYYTNWSILNWIESWDGFPSTYFHL